MDSPEHLLHSSDCDKGYIRLRQGKAFQYFDEKKQRITDPKIIERINSLGIPPAWKKVWICKKDNGNLQASGYDARGRKQYIYHTDWSEYRNLTKFECLYKFGEDLSKIRKQIWQDIALKSWPKEKVIALAIAILDETYIRVGNKYYSETNQTYGLTTLRRKHLKENAGHLTLSYIAKGGKKLAINIENKKLCRLIKKCAELSGYNLFQYLDENNKAVPVSSLDINNYLSSITGERYTAKNFRTWGGSVTALEQLEKSLILLKSNPRLKLTNIIIKGVSQVLTNTTSICRKYYIHPAVISIIEEGEANKFFDLAKQTTLYEELDLYEKQLMLILKEYYSL